MIAAPTRTFGQSEDRLLGRIGACLPASWYRPLAANIPTSR